MLQQLQLEQTPLFRIKDLSTETNEIVDALGEVCPDQTHGPVLPNGIGRADPIAPLGGRRIRWNTQAQSTGHATLWSVLLNDAGNCGKKIDHPL